MRIHTPCHSLLAVTLVVFLCACGEQDEIRSYAVPQVTPAPQPTPTPAPVAPKTTTPVTKEGSGTRLMAAIMPRGDAVWHFKLMGPAAFVGQHDSAFTAFLQSIRFESVKQDDGSTQVEPKWTLPKGWDQKPGSGMRYATIMVGEAPHAMELTVFRLGPESGDVLPNVQRWAGQVGVGDVTAANLDKFTTKLVLDGQPATLVDVTGPGGDGSMAGGPRRPAPAPAGPEKLVAPPPAGWTQDPQPGQFLITKYDIAKDGKAASLTVSRVGGSPVANMNRWREQVGLQGWDEEGAMKAFEAQKELKEGQLGGRPAMIVDFTGPESAGENRERILGALTISQTGEFWFFKLRGPADLVSSQKDAFDAFLAGVKFE